MDSIRWSRLFAVFSVFFGLGAHAAIPKGPLVVKPGKVSGEFDKGTAIGGKARDELSLLAVRLEPTGNPGSERISLMYGDRFGKPLTGEPGYFHVAVDRKSQRIVIDMSQVQMTAVSPARLASILARSNLVSSSEMTMDPIDGTTNITLQTKVPVKVKVGTAEGDSSRVFIEMSPVAGARR